MSSIQEATLPKQIFFHGDHGEPQIFQFVPAIIEVVKNGACL